MTDTTEQPNDDWVTLLAMYAEAQANSLKLYENWDDSNNTEGYRADIRLADLKVEEIKERIAAKEKATGELAPTKRSLATAAAIRAAVASNDVDRLLNMIEWPPCGCVGSPEGEKLCRCKMTAKQVQEAVSYAALRGGRIVELKPKVSST